MLGAVGWFARLLQRIVVKACQKGECQPLGKGLKVPLLTQAKTASVHYSQSNQ